jgi:hypothetical protein
VEAGGKCPVLKRLMTRVDSLNGLLTASATGLSALVFPAALIPEQLEYLGALGSVLAVVLFVLIAALAPFTEVTRRRVIRLSSIVLLIAAVLVVLVRINFIHEIRDCTCLVGWSVSDTGHEMIQNIGAVTGSRPRSPIQILESGELALIDIPQIYGTSYQALKNVYASAYIALFVALVSLLGISETTNKRLFFKPKGQ